MLILRFGVAVQLLFLGMISVANAGTDKLDNLAACSGVVLGNGAVDLFLGDEASFDAAADIAYTAYLSEVFTGGYAQSDLEIADKILGGNTDKVIVAYNSDAFSNDLYEEIVGCYRLISTQLIEESASIAQNAAKWAELKENSIATIKRMLKAG
ncbi:MAG: hypothetical protein ACPH92_07035 [Candidatus Puniceispirillaceae bacterium]